MRIQTVAATFYALTAISTCAYSQPKCVAPDLSDRQVREIIGKERARRKDLPPAHPKPLWTVRKDGCYYIAIEAKLSESPGDDNMVVVDADNIFTLNQYGVIVDVQVGNSVDTQMGKGCPGRVLSKAELTEIVRKEREVRKDLPPPFPKFRIGVSRLHCLYLYYEFEAPGTNGKYLVFEIDQFGGFMHVTRSDPR